MIDKDSRLFCFILPLAKKSCSIVLAVVVMICGGFELIVNTTYGSLAPCRLPLILGKVARGMI